ncbi:transcriptional adapter 2-beta-like isoform X1 [Amphibalanus amphitrite]|uniref:transcriptional adapter 2-beta-like isoform X1 n=1 Tax=Amphibalanus amphitrite TaxID=1232801 RepID=UPI001C913F67|nr:transcriptional adapter 2-beta-like isoform X1 [Amphibalanus amphitrite]
MAADTFGRFHCNYCQENINGLRIKCVECEDFDLCLQCFACGAEIGKHKNNHSYQFMDPGNFTVFNGESSWTAKEDVRLLDAIEQYGYGNWVDIAKHIERRTPDEAQEKFVTYFVNGVIGRQTMPPISELERMPVAVDHTAADGAGPLSPSLTMAPGMAPLQLEPEQAVQLGYMPLRDDFEREYDNTCETLVSQLNIGSVEDEDVDVALKLAHVDMYVQRQRERARRKRVVRDYQLPAAFFEELKKEALLQVPGGARMPRRRKDKGRTLADRLRTLGQFLTRSEYQQFHDNLQAEKDLVYRIKELMRYRRNGITKIADCVEFERARARRNAENGGEDKKAHDPESRQAQAPLLGPQSARKSCASPERKSETLATGASSSLSGSFSTSDSSSSSLSQAAVGPAAAEELPPSPPSPPPYTVEPEPLNESAGYHMLSKAEKRLCARLRLRPANYVALKTGLLSDQLMRCRGDPVRPRALTGLDKHHRKQILSFLVTAGWITA